jgi:hypothetical protein
VARTTAIVAGTWDVFVIALANLSRFKQARPAVQITAVPVGGPLPAQAPGRVRFVMDVAGWATVDDGTAQVQADWPTVMEPALYVRYPEPAGTTPKYAQHVQLYSAWIAFCEQRGIWPQFAAEVGLTAHGQRPFATEQALKDFVSAVTRVHDRIDPGTAWPAMRDRTDVENKFAAARRWLESDPTAPPLRDVLSRR